MTTNQHFIRTYGGKGKRTISITPFSPILNAKRAISQLHSSAGGSASRSSISLGSERGLRNVTVDSPFNQSTNSTLDRLSFKVSSPILSRGDSVNLSRSTFDESAGDKTPILTPEEIPKNYRIFDSSFAQANTSQALLLRKQSSFAESLLPLANRTSDLLSVPGIYEKVLEECNQTEAIKMEQYIANKTFTKLGEGAFAEVFRCCNAEGNESIIKIMPVEGKQLMNGEEQKKFEDILAEMVIARELSSLRYKDSSGIYQTNNFIELLSVACCRGCFPKKLITIWKEWDEEHNSENDCPDIFTKDQFYIIMEFPFGGIDLERFPLESTEQAESIIQQIVYALAVAEQALLFEHRDLHWSNVLIRKTQEKTCSYIINGQKYEIPSKNVHVSIIDFTLSRLEQDGCISFFNLSEEDWLFTGEGDYQFDIYRMMKEKNKNEWESFNAKTNVYWLHYLTDKLLKGKKYPKGRKRNKFLTRLYDKLLDYESSHEVVTGELLLDDDNVRKKKRKR